LRELLLVLETARVVHRALEAQGLQGEAGVAPVQDEVVMGVAQVLRRDDLHELRLDLEGILAGCQPGAVGDPEDVRVDRQRELAEGDVQHHVGGLAADARQRLERLASAWHLAAVLLEEDVGQRDDVLRLAAVQADRADVGLEPLDPSAATFAGVLATG
jgi:hypothetical protein